MISVGPAFITQSVNVLGKQPYGAEIIPTEVQVHYKRIVVGTVLVGLLIIKKAIFGSKLPKMFYRY